MNDIPEQSAAASSGKQIETSPQITAVEVTSYAGPLPHPEILARFEEIHPGATKLLFEEFHSEAQHRRAMEASVIKSAAFSEIVGTIAASLLGLLGIGGGLWLAHEGRSIGGLSSLFGTLAALVGTYLYQSQKQQSNPSDQSGGPATRKRRQP